MVTQVGQGSPSAGERLASPSQARSVAALFLAAGAQPHEIDGAVQVLVRQSERRLPPMSYEEVASHAIEALKEYRETTVDAEPEDLPSVHG